MLNVKILVAIWVVSLVATCMTIKDMSWPFWVSLAVFIVCCALMNRDKKYYESELKDWLGSDEDFD